MEDRMINRRTVMVAAALAAAILTTPASAQDKSIVVSSTTSTKDSGLFGYILPLFKEKTRIDVKVITQGTGQALANYKINGEQLFYPNANDNSA
jgi:tungstate transport system substrate-binding protein